MAAPEAGEISLSFCSIQISGRAILDPEKAVSMCASTGLPLVSVPILSDVELGPQDLVKETAIALMKVISCDVRVIAQIDSSNRKLASMISSKPVIISRHIAL